MLAAVIIFVLLGTGIRKKKKSMILTSLKLKISKTHYIIQY